MQDTAQQVQASPRFECGRFVYLKFIDTWNKYFLERAEFEFPREFGKPRHWNYHFLSFGSGGGYPCQRVFHSEDRIAEMISNGTLAMDLEGFKSLVALEKSAIERTRESFVQAAIARANATIDGFISSLEENAEAEIKKECLFR